MKITNLYVFYFASGLDGGTLALRAKQQKFPIDPKKSWEFPRDQRPKQCISCNDTIIPDRSHRRLL